MKIDVDQVLRQRAPRWHRRLPRFVVRWIERLICQDEMNRVLAVTGEMRGAEFCRGVMRELNVESTARRFVKPQTNAVLYACNHPLGGLDGMGLIDHITRLHGVEPYFVVNDLLGVLKPLDGVFVPINKHGTQSRGAVADVDRAFNDLSRPIVMFPAGLCSRKGKDGSVRDLKWNKMFVHKSAMSGRDIIPVRCFSENSKFFYNFARLRQRLGLKFNVEMILLPREMVRSAGKRLLFVAGEKIPSQTLAKGSGAAAMADSIRTAVYNIELEN